MLTLQEKNNLSQKLTKLDAIKLNLLCHGKPIINSGGISNLKWKNIISTSAKIAKGQPYICIVELGSFKAAAIIAQIKYPLNNNLKQSSNFNATASYQKRPFYLKILGAEYCESKGISNGKIIDAPAAEKTIKHIVENAQKQAKLNVSSIILCLESNQVSNQFISQQLDKSIIEQLANSKNYHPNAIPKKQTFKVTKQHLSLLYAKIKLQLAANQKHLIHCMPIYYSLCDNNQVQNPVGMITEKIKIRCLVSSVPQMIILNYFNLFENCGLKINMVANGALANSLACSIVYNSEKSNLNNENNHNDAFQKQPNQLVVQLGHQNCYSSCWINDKFIPLKNLNVGGLNINQQIADKFGLSQKEAQNIKIKHSNLNINNNENYSKPLYPNNHSRNKDYFPILNNNSLNVLVHKTIKSFLLQIKSELEKQNLQNIIQTVTLSGGLANIPNVDSLAESVFDKPCNVGRPNVLTAKLPPEMCMPSFCSIIGSALIAAFESSSNCNVISVQTKANSPNPYIQEIIEANKFQNALNNNNYNPQSSEIISSLNQQIKTKQNTYNSNNVTNLAENIPNYQYQYQYQYQHQYQQNLNQSNPPDVQSNPPDVQSNPPDVQANLNVYLEVINVKHSKNYASLTTFNLGCRKLKTTKQWNTIKKWFHESIVNV